MEIAMFGVLIGILSALGSLFVPGISTLESCVVYAIVSVATVAMMSALSWLPVSTDRDRG